MTTTFSRSLRRRGQGWPRHVGPSPRPTRRSRREREATFALVLALLATTAFAGNRVRQGGTLHIALVSPAAAVEPLTADAPVDTLRLLLTHQLLCRVVELSRPSSTQLRITTPPSLDPKLVTDALNRVQNAAGPARALLSGVTGWTITGRTVDLQLKQGAPDLERILCHPSFAIPFGAFRAKGSQLEAFDEQPLGRPHLDALVLKASDARTVERWFAAKSVQVIAGAATTEDVPQLFVTALALGPGLSGVRTAIEATVDRGDLARFFVSAPSAGLTSLLPPALATSATPTTPPKPAPIAPPRELTLRFDDAAPHEKAIAQRLQVKLEPFGYRVALKPLARPELPGHPAQDNELVLHSFALPPSPTGALLMWLELGGQRARIPSVLQQLATATDADAKAQELAMQLGAELPLVPLVTRGLGVTTARQVQHLTRDVLGLPRFDDVFLVE